MKAGEPVASAPASTNFCAPRKQRHPQEIKPPTANAALMEAVTGRKAHWVRPTLVAEVFH
jgi:hypothetical protein